MLANLQRLGRLAIGWAPCLLGLAVLAVVGRRHVRAWRWPLFVLALAGVPLAMYVAIHIEYRYIGAFVVLLLMAAFAAMRGPDTQQARRLTAAVVTVVFVAQVTPVAATIAYDTAHEVKGLVRRRSADPPSLADRARPAGARPSAGRSRGGGR